MAALFENKCAAANVVLPELFQAAPSSATIDISVRLPLALQGRTNSLDSFEAWLQSYLRESKDERMRIESVGLQLALARRAALPELIETDPECAWKSRVRWAAKKELPTEIHAQLGEHQASTNSSAAAFALELRAAGYLSIPRRLPCRRYST